MKLRSMPNFKVVFRDDTWLGPILTMEITLILLTYKEIRSLEYPCHSQAVERVIWLVSESSKIYLIHHKEIIGFI